MKPRAADFILAAAVAIFAALIWIIPLRTERGREAHISQDGKKFSVRLSRDAEYKLRGCTAVTKDGEIFISETECPDRICEKTGKISSAGEAIICIPQRVEIRISGDAEIDAVAG